MGKPTVRSRPMPVLYLGRNVNHISRVQFLSGFAPLLIITPTRRTKKDLTAVMVDVPVVPALNWTPSPQSLVVAGFNSIHICALCELFVTSSFARLFLCFSLIPNLFCKVKDCPAFWPTCIECYVGDNRCDFFLRYPMILGIL